ncbi:MAG: hypothetical protein MUC88_09315 [Planctomycetes bacterium]|nr:hypothetical protein [Planctomycetota bacterium]
MRHILGLAIDDAGVVATELSVQSGRVELRRTGELLWEQELTADSVKPLGLRLRHFLREQGFSAKRAVVGLAAKWVLTKEIETPPASAEVLAGMLSIQAERAFSLDAEELIFDYCGGTPTTDRNRESGKAGASEKSQVLLLAARRQVIGLIRELTEAAGLQLQAVTVSALACSRVSSGSGAACSYGLYARPTYCEFWAQTEGSPRLIKHVPMSRNGTPDGYVDLLGSTVERLLLLSPIAGQRPPYQIAAYDACGLPERMVDGLGRRLGDQIKVSDGCSGLRSRGLSLGDRPETGRALAATAVALTGIGTDRPLVDFLNPRVGAKKAASHTQAITWGAVLAGAGVLALGILLLVWHGYSRDITADKAWLKTNDTQIAAAQEAVDRYTYAGSWDSRDPQFLECLRGLTAAFPQEPSIWASSLALNENGTGSIVGKTSNEQSFHEVLDQLKQTPEFSDVKMIHLRDVGRDSREKEFAISFKFKFQGAK